METSITLKGQAADLKLKNPILTASGTFGSGLEFMPYGDLASLGGVVVKGISLKPRAGNPTPRIVETTAGMLNSIGLQNDGVENFIKSKLPRLPWKETAIIPNLYGTSPEEFGELAAIFNSLQEIRALEVNVSCPNVKAGGALFGADPVMCAHVVEAVRKNAPSKHIIVKLSPNVTDIAEIAKSCETAGADSVSAINTLLGMAVNLTTRRPCLANIVGGLSGPAIKPVALRAVWQLRNALKIPVIGIGGITLVDDALEFLMVGASAIQIGTANLMRPDTSFRIAADLPQAIKKYGFDSLPDLIGSLIV